jgi:hypothetical protein
MRLCVMMKDIGGTRSMSSAKKGRKMSKWPKTMPVNGDEYFALTVVSVAVKRLLTDPEFVDMSDTDWRSLATFALGSTLLELQDVREE